jgi:2-polyprenyl-3-methyl-5-hydroxy-6-metoxy-1,4-benzoquinol methylase
VRDGIDGRELAAWASSFGVGYDGWRRAYSANDGNFLDVLAWGHDHDFGGGVVVKGTMDDRHVTNMERVDQPGGLDPGCHVAGKRCLIVGAYCGGEVLLLHALGAREVDAIEEVPEYAAACARLADAFGVPGRTRAASLYECGGATDPGGGYDLVYVPGVVYHLTDVVTALRILRDLARPGGSVFIETPIAADRDTYLGPSVRGWNWWVLTARTYMQIMADVGLRDVRHVETTGGRAWFGGVRGDADPLADNGCAGFALPRLIGRRRGYR